MVYIIKNTKWHSQTGGNIDFVFSSRKKYPLPIIQELPTNLKGNEKCACRETFLIASDGHLLVIIIHYLDDP